jgi:hypothetical protein
MGEQSTLTQPRQSSLCSSTPTDYIDQHISEDLSEFEGLVAHPSSGTSMVNRKVRIQIAFSSSSMVDGLSGTHRSRQKPNLVSFDGAQCTSQTFFVTTTIAHPATSTSLQ